MITNIASVIYLFLAVLVSIAYYTLLERKLLAAIQLRLGPNKVGIEGLLQPLADAIKLFLKINTNPLLANKTIFLLSPIIKLTIALIIWAIIPNPELNINFRYRIIYFLCLSSIIVYIIIGIGWASNSKYALLGTLRGFAQIISYEVTIGLIIIAILIPINRLNTIWIFKNRTFSLALLSPPILYIWFTIILAETNRAPFDFTEAESELVSGFNIEYRGTPFAFIFISEYINIISISFITSLLLLQNFSHPVLSYLAIVTQRIFIIIIFIIVRGTIPRIRYDKLIDLTWKYFLTIRLFYISINSTAHTIFINTY